MKKVHVDNKEDLEKYNELVLVVPTIVLFYSPMCGHCMAMKDEWEKFENDIENLEGNGLVARVRNDYINDVNGDSDVMGYPTILSLQNGEKVDEFDDERTRENFIKFLESQNPELKKNMKGGKRKVKKSLKRKSRKVSKKSKSRKIKRKSRKVSKKSKSRKIRK